MLDFKKFKFQIFKSELFRHLSVMLISLPYLKQLRRKGDTP